jgi:hypothetical protein
MAMKVMTMKMPAMRASFLSESVGRSSVADADPFGVTGDMGTPCLERADPVGVDMPIAVREVEPRRSHLPPNSGDAPPNPTDGFWALNNRDRVLTTGF